MLASHVRRIPLPAAGAAVLLLGVASLAAAQTDYYNTDRNRPVRVEDAYTVERYAFELKVASLRLERAAGGAYHWGIEPELAYGVLPRTSIELGMPFGIIDAGGENGRRHGLAGVELSLFHNLNAETTSLPALAIRGDVILPAGALSADRTYSSLTAISTRTFAWARFHLNGQYTFGDAPGDAAGETAADGTEGGGIEEVPRWLAGIAADRVFPLRAMLVTAEVYAAQPLHADDDVEWHGGAGVRYQVNPYLAVDAGAGRRLTGTSSWYFTAGGAWHFAIRGLIPAHRRPGT